MKIVIMGSGAIGCLYGGLFQKIPGNEVVLVGREPHVDEIQKRGLVIKGVLGDMVIDIEATDNPRQVSEADIVFITTKTYDTLEAAERVRHLIDSGAFVVVLQNGLGTEDIVAESLETTRVLRSTTCMGAIMSGLGEVTVTGDGLTEIGTHYKENADLLVQTVELLEEAGFNVQESENIAGVVWTKTIVNCGINPIGALTGLKNGEIYTNTALRDLVIKLVQETAEVASAMGVTLTTDDPIRYTLGTAKATGSNINSMLQDIRKGKRTEIEHITGEVIRLGKKFGIPTPASEIVYALVKALEEKRTEQVPVEAIAEMSPEDLVEVMSST